MVLCVFLFNVHPNDDFRPSKADKSIPTVIGTSVCKNSAAIEFQPYLILQVKNRLNTILNNNTQLLLFFE